MARFQWEKYKGTGGLKPWNLDIAAAYLIKGPALRLIATYSHTKTGDVSGNMVQLGAQAIFF